MTKAIRHVMSEYGAVFACLALFIINSCVLFFMAPSPDSYFECDSRVYDAVAHYFCEHGRIYDPTLTLVPMQPIGYHLFVGLIYALCGPYYWWIIIAQGIMSLAIGILMYRIASRFLGKEVALIALGLFSIHLGFLIYTQLLLAEIILTLLLMLFWERIILFWDSKSGVVLMQAAFILSMSAIIKPIALVFIYPLLICFWFSMEETWILKVFRIFVFATVFFVPIVLYMFRNYVLYGVFHFAPMMEVNLYQCLLSKVMARVDGIRVDEGMRALAPTSTNLFDPNVWAAQRELFHSYLAQHPFAFVVVWVQNVIKTVVGLFTTQLKVFFNPEIKGGSCSFFAMKSEGAQAYLDYIRFGATSSWLVAVGIVETFLNVTRIFFIALGMRYAWVSGMCNKKLLVMIGIFIATSYIITGVDGCFRYRLPSEPFLIMATALGIYEVCHYASMRYRRAYG